MSDEQKRPEPVDKIVQETARKAASNPLFLASALESYRHGAGLDEAALVKELGIFAEDLPRLALCRRPDSADSIAFRRAVDAICKRFSIKPAQLANILRKAEAYEKITRRPEADPYLLAARDYEEDPLEPPSSDGPQEKDHE
ncbi:MAG TPA: hypothetical protein VH186_24850 [Chloroflexia bacterium]|nr:hypothetical protein [Chloroflexia bacterium]